jgi:flagellar biosynthetic protein FliR
MEQFLGSIYARFPTFLLAGLRVMGLFIMSPVFGRRNIPAATRIGFALLLTYILIPMLPADTQYELLNPYVYTLKCLQEILLGLAMGYLTTLFFSVALTAGEYIDTQIGMGMANILDPYSNSQVPLVGNFLNVMGLLLFFAVDGHHMLIRLLASTFIKIPPGQITVQPALGMMAAEYFATTFVMAIQIALPVIAVSLMTETAFAIIMRTVPQLNFFAVGIPLKAVLGILILIVILPVYRFFMENAFEHMRDAIERIFEGFAVG